MSVRQKTRAEVDFSKLTPDEQMNYSREKMQQNEMSENEFLGREAKKKIDRFRSLNVR